MMRTTSRRRNDSIENHQWKIFPVFFLDGGAQNCPAGHALRGLHKEWCNFILMARSRENRWSSRATIEPAHVDVRTALWLFRTLLFSLQFFPPGSVSVRYFLQLGWRLSVTFGPFVPARIGGRGSLFAGFRNEGNTDASCAVPSRVRGL
jgi:hypothetical protein